MLTIDYELFCRMSEKGFILLPTEVDKIVDPFVDTGNLLIIDNDPLIDEDSTK